MIHEFLFTRSIVFPCFIFASFPSLSFIRWQLPIHNPIAVW